MKLPDSEGSRAVLIGTSTYGTDSGFASLPTVARNLTEFASFLRRQTGLRHVTVVVDPDGAEAFSDALEPAIDEAEDLLLFYYSGHGVAVGREDLGLTHSCSRVRRPGNTTQRYSDIRDGIRASRATVKVVILDCCHAGRAFGGGTLAGGDQDEALEQLAVIDGTYVLTATDTKTKFADATSHDGCTAFTSALLDVLRSGRPSADGFLSMADVFPLLREKLKGRNCPAPRSSGGDTASGLALVQRQRSQLAIDMARMHQVVIALVKRGDQLGGLGRFEEAIEEYERVAQIPLYTRASVSGHEVMREFTAKALVKQGNALGALGRFEDAVVAYERMISEYCQDPGPALRELVATARVEEGNALGALGRFEDAVEAYERMISKYSGDPAPALRELVATALVSQGMSATLWFDDELDVYERVIRDYADDPAPALQKQVATALVQQGGTLWVLGRFEEAITAYQRVIFEYSLGATPAMRAPTLAFRDLVAQALVCVGRLHWEKGQSDQAIAAYKSVIRNYADDPAPALRKQVAAALVYQGDALGGLGRSEEALTAYQRVINDYASDPAPALRNQVARALVYQGDALGALGRSEEARTAYQRVINDYASDPAPALRGQIAAALARMNDPT
ncbi:caspase, EACC1-associated type (plasmid) [Nocardia sp. CA-084685]|uniref:caspase, EACC1-associated type n=1 Tax=Nocardia sp. CA-084685 TaxID=3239970 RepID=UPI003D994464